MVSYLWEDACDIAVNNDCSLTTATVNILCLVCLSLSSYFSLFHLSFIYLLVLVLLGSDNYFRFITYLTLFDYHTLCWDA
jgi:hypothetical protein